MIHLLKTVNSQVQTDCLMNRKYDYEYLMELVVDFIKSCLIVSNLPYNLSYSHQFVCFVPPSPMNIIGLRPELNNSCSWCQTEAIKLKILNIAVNNCGVCKGK